MAEMEVMSDGGTLTALLRSLASFPYQQSPARNPARRTTLGALLRGFPSLLQQSETQEPQQQEARTDLTLASITVVLVWTEPAYERCIQLQQQFQQLCAIETRHQQQDDGKHYFSAFWLSMGFVRVGSMVNAISLGVDTIFMDSDTVILRDFLPLIRSLEGADIVTSTERCIVRNYSRPYERTELGAWTVNIGFVYLRAVPGNVRCASSWMARMFLDTVTVGRTWDQVAFNVVFPDCYRHYGLVWYGLDPRLFQQGCGSAGFKQCGCSFDDAEFAGVGPIPARQERMSSKFLPFSAPGVCRPADWGGWYTKHYNCIPGINGSSPQTAKAMYMRNLLQASRRNQAGHIMPHSS